MNSEAEKNEVLDVRQELEALRNQYSRSRHTIIRGDIGDKSLAAVRLRSAARQFGRFARELDALLQRIPDGWEFRPREPSEEMQKAGSGCLGAQAEPASFNSVREAWRAMWDEAGEEPSDG